MKISDIVKRQTEESNLPYYAGTWSELEALADAHFEKGYEVGANCISIPVPPYNFFTATCRRGETGKQPAEAVDLICYNVNGEWEVVVIHARLTNEYEPPHPYIMAKQMLGLDGETTRHIYSGEEFARSVYYWTDKVSVDGYH